MSRDLIRYILLAVFSSIFLMACNLSTAGTPSPTPTTTTTAVRPVTLTLTRKPTATPVQLTLQVTASLANCRIGPGIVYEFVNELREGRTARVVGRNGDSTWWYIRDPGNPNGYCWISANVTEVRGDTSLLPVAAAPVTSVLDVNLVVEPVRMDVDCALFPQTFFFEAQITADGPLIALWQWEASTGAVSETSTLVFEQAGTQVLNQYYQVGAPNEYWVRLHILQPNEITKQVTFRITCRE